MTDRDTHVVVFVHGWSVTSTDTYGELPARLELEAKRKAGLDLDVHNIWLGKYVSFKDEVRLEDIARGFKSAVKKQLGTLISRGKRFVCITHSTGSLVVRDWWNRYYPPEKPNKKCPMSHLIMLAPANFGSALAQLGKGRLSRLKSWTKGIEPGQGVLDWLELGSPESWDLNRKWMSYPDFTRSQGGVFPFVLTGQTIDRSLYDHVNSYTGETGSDGVVRVAAANLNSSYVLLEQKTPTRSVLTRAVKEDNLNNLEVALELKDTTAARRTAFALIRGCSHSGKDLGIIRSVKRTKAHPTVDAVLKCMLVRSPAQYTKLRNEFDKTNKKVIAKERVEIHDRFLLPDSYTFHDVHSMVIFRMQDDLGYPLSDFDLKLTAGVRDLPNSPDLLPKGFFVDRQRNSRHPSTITYFLNHDVVKGTPAIHRKIGGRKSKEIRPRQKGVTRLGIELIPRPREGYAHYVRATVNATTKLLDSFLKPNETTLVDIVLKRLVHEGVFELTKDKDPKSFKKQPTGEVIS